MGTSIRHVLGGFVTAGLIATSASPATSDPEVYVYNEVGQEAYAAWAEPIREGRWRGLITVVLVFRGAIAPETGTYALVAELRCPWRRARWDPFLCRGRWKVHDLPLDAFTMDPLMLSATLRIPYARGVHSVRWDATQDVPTTFAYPFVHPIEEDQYWNTLYFATSRRSALASGRVNGKHFRANHDRAVATLSTGTYGYASVYPWLD